MNAGGPGGGVRPLAVVQPVGVAALLREDAGIAATAALVTPEDEQ
jgi:hypothetical protein